MKQLLARLAALALFALAGCSSPSAKPEPPPAKPAAAPTAVAAPAGEACGKYTCTPPESCITVVGMRPDSAREECWITCANNTPCPSGMECAMISDGPGHVCVKKER